MLCQVCKENEATVHYTELANNKVAEIHLCEKCALEQGVNVKPPFFLADLMAGLVEAGKPSEVEREQICKNCGLRYSDFKSIGRLGCARCYETFKEGLSELLQKVHGSSVHAGKGFAISPDKQDTESNLGTLRNRLQKLIEEEAFEEAARVRDQIKKLLEKENK